VTYPDTATVVCRTSKVSSQELWRRANREKMGYRSIFLVLIITNSFSFFFFFFSPGKVARTIEEIFSAPEKIPQPIPTTLLSG